MEGNDIVLCQSPNSALQSTFTETPGNNPFDELWKKTVDAVSMSEQTNRRASIFFTGDCQGACRRSLSFHDISEGDFGRESMGILPPDFGRDLVDFSSELRRESLWKDTVNAASISEINRKPSTCFTDCPTAGRPSLSLCGISTGCFGRESMGILPPDFGRDLVDFMNISSSELGRASLWKDTVNAASISQQINRKSSTCFTDCPTAGRASLSLCDISAGDFGRESMGILPPDFGRDSLGFMNIGNSEFGRESLGILQNNAITESLNLRRESFGIHKLLDFGRDSIECGRESLGILHLKSSDFKFPDEDKRVPDILLSTIEEASGSLYGILDTAFLLPHSRKSSAISSNASSVNPSFYSNSLEGPSKIYSLSSSENLENRSNLLNNVFNNVVEPNSSNSSDVLSIHSSLNRGKLFSSSESLNLRSRIQSLPVNLEDKCNPVNDEAAFNHPIERKCWSTDQTMRHKILENKSFHGTLDFGDTDTSAEFRDSVFIEGHHFAEKIADGSILNYSGDEVGILDSTPQPNWPDELNDNENKDKEVVKCDTETIFKAVDKMLPPPVRNNINYKLKTSKADSNLSNESNGDESNLSENNSRFSQTSEKNLSKLLQNLSHISHDSNKSAACRRIKDPKEILQNLSEILNCTNRSDQQKSEGQNLLSSLADILSINKLENKSDTKSTSLDDSGHSSINEQPESPKKENYVCFEVLNPCTKNTSRTDSKEDVSNKSETFNLCIKPKSIENIVDQRLSKSSSSSIPNLKGLTSNNVIKKTNSSVSGLDFSKNKITTSNSSVNSNISVNSNLSIPSIAGKWRQKSINSSTKKGPLKAVIPVGDMKKKNNTAVTPERTEKIPLTIQSKRTSTPIHEPKLKPMAASTPTMRSIKSQKNTGTTPIARPKRASVSSTITKTVSNVTTALPKSSTKLQSNLLRRNSVSEFKRTSESIGKIQRSNSIEQGTGIVSGLSNVRQNIVNSPYYQLRQQNILKENNNTAEIKVKTFRNRSSSFRKSTDWGQNLKQVEKLNSSRDDINNAELPISYSKKTASPNMQKDQNHKLPSQLHVAKTKESSGKIRYSVNNYSTGNSSKRKKSLGNDTGMLSSLAKIRQNMLNSPHFPLRNENESKEFQGISENKIPLGKNKDLQLGKETLFSKLKKADKENMEK